MIRIYLVAAGLLALAALAVGLWQAGARAERTQSAAATAKVRIEMMEQTRGARNAAENLDDDGLVDALGRWLLPRP